MASLTKATSANLNEKYDSFIRICRFLRSSRIMFYLVKRFLQLIFVFIWCLTLINLILLSSILFIISNIFLLIFLFWLILTLCAWSITFIPILKYVFLPWHRRQCRLWTRNYREKRYSVAFLHQSSTKINDQQRIHWTIIESLLKTYSRDIEIIIYTDNDDNPKEFLRTVKDKFHIDLTRYRQSALTFIHLQTYSKHFPLFNSILISFEALLRFLPDIYIDSIGNPCTYPCFSCVGSVPILSYFQQSILRYDLFDMNSLASRLKLIVCDCLNLLYVCCANCSTKIFCHSLWLKQRFDSNDVQVLYPPVVVVEQFDEKSTKTLADERTNLVSIGEFCEEENHQLQIHAFHQFLQKKPEYRSKTKLILIGNDEKNRDYIEQLKNLVEELNLNDLVQFKFNLNSEELKTTLQQATIGLHTTENDDFKIAILEMMAADLIIVAHESGAPKLDLSKDDRTILFAYDIDSYASKFEQIFDLSKDERCQISQNIRDNLNRFNRLNFEKVFFHSFEKILFVK